MNIFDQLDNIIKSVTPVNEAEKHVMDDIDPDYATSEQGIIAAAKQMAERVFGGGSSGPGGGGGKTEMEEVDDPLKPKSSGGGGDGVDKTFRSSSIDGLDDDDDLDDEKKSKGEKDDSPMEDDDFEFDDFDYEDKKPSSGDESDNESSPSSGGSGSGGESSEEDYDYEDGDFDDSDLGDADDYDFGDDDDGDGDGDGETGGGSSSGKRTSGGESGDSKESGGDGSESGGESGGKSSSSGSSGSSKSKSSKSGESGGESGDSGDDVDYDDTLDYDSNDYDTLESEIEDALNRTKDGATSKHEKEALDKMKDTMSGEKGESGESGEKGEKSSSEKAEELSKEIEKSLDESDTGSGELAGESLDDVPDDKSMEEDMSKAGFDKKDIDKMKKAKDTDTSGEIDEEKVAKEAMEEMDKRAKERGERTGSSLSRTIMRNVLKGKVTNMEWKEMVGVFLKSKSKTTGGSFAKSKSTGWGDKKHLWRDAVMPKSVVSGGDINEINCFIDFSGSVSQPLVFSFLQRVLSLCGKLSFGKVNVYGFGEELSEPFVIKKKDLIKGDEKKQEEYLNKMWEFISNQELGGSIENFEVVAKEILKLKRKDHDCPIMIFGDGLWGVSYPNPKPPIYLKELCSRYLKDILALVYYEKDYYDEWIGPEIGYLREIVGLKHVVTTEIKELR